MLIDTLQYIIERSQEFTTALGQHLSITFIALGISVAIGLIFGVIASRIKWLRNVLLTIGNIGRTIPSLAILALALPLLGIGAPPTILALVIIGTLPILVNTTIGIEEVDPNVKEAARGMGMNDLQVLVRVEIPVAIAVIMAGIRTSAVLVVASATLAAFIGGGGLGDLILRGHALVRNHIVLAGAIPATLLAFYFEETFGRLEKWVTPIGLKIGMPGFEINRSGLLDFLSAVFLMPLLFGLMMPWETFTDPEGVEAIITGMHPQYSALAVTVLLLGFISALWPSSEDSKVSTYVTSGTAVIGLLLMIFLVWKATSMLPTDHSLQTGIYLQLGTMAALVAIALLEFFQVGAFQRKT
ncbi:MAG: ABC transporter permease [Anaerolineales bacterium]